MSVSRRNKNSAKRSAEFASLRSVCARRSAHRTETTERLAGFVATPPGRREFIADRDRTNARSDDAAHTAKIPEKNGKVVYSSPISDADLQNILRLRETSSVVRVLEPMERRRERASNSTKSCPQQICQGSSFRSLGHPASGD
jgi:hypothetical protein